jgi:hypothetical protein
LSSCRAFLQEAAELLSSGGVLVGGPSLPPGLPGGLETFLRKRNPTLVIRRLVPAAAAIPIQMVAAEFGIDARDLSELVGLLDHIAIIDLVEMGPAKEGWLTFLRRIMAAQSGRDSCFSAFLILREMPKSREGLPIVEWRGRLRRLDIAIWADLHSPLQRSEPLAALGEALAPWKLGLGDWTSQRP